MTLSAVLEHRFTWALLALLGGVIGSYFLFNRETLKEIYVVKGMLAALLQRGQECEKVKEKVIVLDKDHDKTKYDVRNAWTAIREIKQGGSPNGNASPEPSGHG